MTQKCLTRPETVSQECGKAVSVVCNDPDCGCHSNQDWYVVQAAPGGIHLAFNGLSKRFRCHLPRIIVERRKYRHGRPLYEHGKPVITEAAELLFPGYFMVAFEYANPQWGQILREPGVLRLISSREASGSWRPARLPHGFVERLQRAGRMGDGAIDLRAPAGVGPGVGTVGKILDGPFASFAAVVTMSGTERIKVLASIFGRTTEVEMPVSAFEATG